VKITIRALIVLVVLLSMIVLALPSGGYAQEVKEQRFIVGYKPGHKEALTEFATARGGQIHYEFDTLNALAVTLPSTTLTALGSNPDIVSIEEDVPRYPDEQVIPYGVASVKAPDVWDHNQDGQIDPGAPTGAGRLICIIDSGVDRDHEDLADINFVGGSPSDWGTDNCGHGTHVTGIIGAVNNAAGVVGVSPGAASLYVVKVYGDLCTWTWSSTLINAALTCQSAGADIISMSLSGSIYSTYENTMFQSLYDDGILLVAAAGNGGGTSYGYPASYSSVISVGAVDEDNLVPTFSRQNDQVELAAPGVSILSTYRDGGYRTMSGTSMATPHVSAAAAVAWSAAPSKSNVQIREVLRQTADDLGDPGRDNAYGFGLIQTMAAVEQLGYAPTAVELDHFEATAQTTGIVLEWETATELDTLGFHVYRADSPGGPQTRLTADLIPSAMPGSPMGASYQFVDDTASAGQTYTYWLEAIDLEGQSTFYGPVSATVRVVRRLLTARPRPSPAAPALGGQ
jgi:subtilisin family serine protease